MLVQQGIVSCIFFRLIDDNTNIPSYAINNNAKKVVSNRVTPALKVE